MRKHFLILMLTALLPFTAWAAAPAVKTAPAAKNLTYNGGDQALVTAGVVADDAPAGTAIYYAVVAHDAAAPVWNDDPALNPFNAGLPTGDDANQYDVYYLTRLGTENSEVSAKIVVTIGKADLLVKAVSQTTYFGSGTEKLQVVFDGFLGADTEAGLMSGLGFTKPAIAAGNNAVGTYTQTPEGGDALDNYNYVYVGGTLTIEKCRVQILPNNINAYYGSDASKKTSFSTTIAAPDFKIHLQDGYDGEGNPTYAVADATYATYLKSAGTTPTYTGVSLTRANTSTAVGNYVITATGGSLPDAVKDNYQYAYGTGVFTIEKSTVTITPNNNTKVYGEADPTLTYAITGNVTSLPDNVKSQITISRAAGNDVATYAISVSGPATFEGYIFNYAEPAKFMITKRAATITPAAQVLYTGNTAADLDKTAVTFENLVEGDEILLDWSFAAGGNVDGVTGALKMTDVNNESEVANNGIVIAVKAGEEYPNYNLTLNTANLTIINLAKALVLSDTDAALTDKLAVVNNTPKTLAMGSRTLKAETWNVLVLPFDTSVREISEKFGYAVVDLLDLTATDGDIHLKLHMGDIPANTPFIVKNYEDVNLNTIAPFAAKTVKYAVGAEYIDANGNVFVEDAAGNKFVGTYNTTEVYGANIQYMTGKGVFKDAGAYTESSKLSLKPLRAYLQTIAQNANGNAPIIYIEEPDGSTTAIETVNAVKVANANDAIYNLAGQKVGADYKGIVIKNGKRFVQK